MRSGRVEGDKREGKGQERSQGKTGVEEEREGGRARLG